MTNSISHNDRSTSRKRERRAAPRIGNPQFHELISKLQAMGYHEGGSLKTVGLTSANPREGVTTVASNLAIYAASCCDLKVLLIDANFGNPSLHRLFKVKQGPGLSELFDESAIESDCIHDMSKTPIKSWPSALKNTFRRVSGLSRFAIWSHESNSTPRLSVLPLGNCQIGAADFYDQEDDRFLENVCSEFDLVIVDLPAMRSSVNCGFSLSKLDGVLFVLEAEKTSDMVAKKCLNQIKASKSNLLGVAFNKFRRRLPRWIDNKLGD